MKAKFFALAALVLGLASCQNDFDDANVGVGGEIDFQLAVAAPEFGATRAAENGTSDTKAGANSAYGAIDYLQGTEDGDPYKVDWAEFDLRYSLEVYDFDENGNYTAAPVKDRMVQIVDEYEPVVFDLRLVPGRKYHFVVFADFLYATESDNTYLMSNGETITAPTTSIADQQYLGFYHEIGATLGDIKIVNDAINSECTDAYFATKDLTISNSAANNIELKRPYGKLRVIATDLAELNLNVNPQRVQVDYTTEIPTTFNAVTGEVDTRTADKTYVAVLNVTKEDMSRHLYTEGYDSETTTNANNEKRYTHVTLFTDYVLAEKEGQTPHHFTMTVFDDKLGQNPIKTTTFSTDIPVQRNHLTTVIGNVLTTGTEINVTINDNFDGEIVNDMVLVNTAKELQEALDNYDNGQTILFDSNINGNVTVDQKEGYNVVIDGNGYEFTGTITIDGNSRYTDETVLIKNVNFVNNNNTEISFVEMNSTDGAVRYAHNVTIEACTFTGGENSVAAKFRQSRNITIKDCVVVSGHSLAQFYGCENILIEGTTVNADRGVSFGTSTRCAVKGSTFIAKSYGLRADGTVATDLNLENVTITALKPVIVRKTNNAYNVNFTGTNELNTTGYQVVFTAGDDDATFVAPTSAFAVTGADAFKVFPRDAATSDYVYNADELTEALANGEDVVLADDIAVAKSEAGSNGYGATGINQLNGGVIDGQGNDISVNAWGTWDSAINTTGGTIKNLNVTGGMRGIFVNHNSTNCGKVILDNVTIDGTVYTISCDQGTNNGLEATNSTFNGWTSYAATIGEVKFTNCSFGEGQGYAYCRPYAPTAFVNCDFAAGYSIDARALVTFENCTIDGVALTVENINTLGSKSANMKLLHNGEFVSVASNTIENQAGVTYTGEFFENPINDALYFNNWYMTGDATIKVVDKTYGAIILENVSGDINGDVIYIDNDNNSVMILENCDFTLAEGKKLIKSEKTIYQVFMANITINGVKLTNENAGQYLENVGWFQVVEEI